MTIFLTCQGWKGRRSLGRDMTNLAIRQSLEAGGKDSTSTHSAAWTEGAVLGCFYSAQIQQDLKQNKPSMHGQLHEHAI